MIDLVEFIAVICPQQKINRATAVPWFEIIGHLPFTTARNAVLAVKHSQAFVDVSDILAEARRTESSRPYDRTAAEAIGAANYPELPPAGAAPPNEDYQRAKDEMDAKFRARAEQALLADREVSRRAGDWIAYKLSGQLPLLADITLSEPASKWTQLPGDPPELRNWLVRKTREGNGEAA
jgi:hypothetical protein